jgi:hypothetical protein
MAALRLAVVVLLAGLLASCGPNPSRWGSCTQMATSAQQRQNVAEKQRVHDILAQRTRVEQVEVQHGSLECFPDLPSGDAVVMMMVSGDATGDEAHVLIDATAELVWKSLLTPLNAITVDVEWDTPGVSPRPSAQRSWTRATTVASSNGADWASLTKTYGKRPR